MRNLTDKHHMTRVFRFKKFIHRRLFVTVIVWTALIACACSSKEVTSHLSTCASAIQTLDYDTAVREADLAAETGEDKREAYRLKGIALFKSARYAEAEEAFQSSLSLSSGIVRDLDFDMNLFLAACKRGAGDFEGAALIYDNILALQADSVEALFERGCTRLELNDVGKATDDFDRAIRITPRDFDLRIRICQAYTRHGLEAAGKALLQEALSNYETAMSSYEKGRFNFYLGNNAVSQSQLENALDSSGIDERAKAALLLGQTGEKQGDYGYAIEVYSSVLEKQPDYAELLNRRGICYMKTGKYDAAVQDFEAGIALGYSPVYQMLLRNEIAAYEYAGAFAKAKNVMKKYVTLFPDDVQAVRDWVFLQTR